MSEKLTISQRTLRAYGPSLAIHRGQQVALDWKLTEISGETRREIEVRSIEMRRRLLADD